MEFCSSKWFKTIGPVVDLKLLIKKSITISPQEDTQEVNNELLDDLCIS